MLRASFLTPFKAPRLSFFSITKINLALAYETFFPLLGPFTNKCLWLSKHNKGKVNKHTEVDGGYSCIPNTYTTIIFRGLKLHIPYATSFHVFLAALRQSCPSQCTCFSPHLWKYHSLIVLSTSLHEAWVYSGYTKASGLKIIWGRREGESVEQSRAGPQGPGWPTQKFKRQLLY